MDEQSAKRHRAEDDFDPTRYHDDEGQNVGSSSTDGTGNADSMGKYADSSNKDSMGESMGDGEDDGGMGNPWIKALKQKRVDMGESMGDGEDDDGMGRVMRRPASSCTSSILRRPARAASKPAQADDRDMSVLRSA